MAMDHTAWVTDWELSKHNTLKSVLNIILNRQNYKAKEHAVQILMVYQCL